MLNGTNFVLGCKSIYIRYRTKYVSVIRPFRLISPLFNKPSSCPLCVNSAYEVVRYVCVNLAHELVRYLCVNWAHELSSISRNVREILQSLAIAFEHAGTECV